MKTNWLCSVCFALSLAFAPVQAQTVTRYAGNDSTLDGRWAWALDQVARSDGPKEFWIGYSIKRLMDEDSHIFSGRSSYGATDRKTNLYSLILGQPWQDDAHTMELRSHGNERLFKRTRDVAVLFFFSNVSGGESHIQKVDLCSMELSVNLKNVPLFWLGVCQDDESVHLLKELFRQAATVDVKKELVEAIGLHQQSQTGYSFLTTLLTGTETDDVRAKGAFWLGEQGNPQGLKLLMNVAGRDHSVKVREEAVFAISRFDLDESTDDLISLARTADNPRIRGKAAFWLGEKASAKVVATLQDIISNDDETEVQRQALFALSQMKDKEGIDRLVNIAKNHPNPRIRKQAIQILSQSDDPKALETLIQIVRQ